MEATHLVANLRSNTASLSLTDTPAIIRELVVERSSLLAHSSGPLLAVCYHAVLSHR